MKIISTLFLILAIACDAYASEDRFTIQNVTESGAAAAGKKQAMVIIFRQDDVPKGEFQKAIAHCRAKNIAMIIGSPDPKLTYTILNRELAITGKKKAAGASIIIVGPAEEDSWLRPLMDQYGIRYIYTECKVSEKKG